MIKYYTVKEMAGIVHRDIRTIYRWIDEGFVKNYAKVKDGYLIPESEVSRILDSKKESIQ